MRFLDHHFFSNGNISIELIEQNILMMSCRYISLQFRKVEIFNDVEYMKKVKVGMLSIFEIFFAFFKPKKETIFKELS